MEKEDIKAILVAKDRAMIQVNKPPTAGNFNRSPVKILIQKKEFCGQYAGWYFV